jgi:hypothetical protein
MHVFMSSSQFNETQFSLAVVKRIMSFCNNFTLRFLISNLKYTSVVGIATRYGLEGPGIESRWGEIFHTYPNRLWGPPSLLYNGYRVFPGGKSGRGMMLTTHPLLVPRLRKNWAIPPLTLWVLLGLLRGSHPLPLLQVHHNGGTCCFML